jgi:hypothetical protein
MKKPQRLREYHDPEYDDEVGMVMTNLQTMTRSARRLAATLTPDENLPEWVQEKIAKATSMIVAATNYMESQHEQGRIYTNENVQSRAENQKVAEIKKSLHAQLRRYR